MASLRVMPTVQSVILHAILGVATSNCRRWRQMLSTRVYCASTTQASAIIGQPTSHLRGIVRGALYDSPRFYFLYEGSAL